MDEIKKDGGMTLAEVLISLFLFTLAAGLLFSGFSATMKLLNKGNDLKDASQTIAGIVEGAPYDRSFYNETVSSGSIVLHYTGGTLKIPGSYTRIEDPDHPSARYETFRAGSVTP